MIRDPNARLVPPPRVAQRAGRSSGRRGSGGAPSSKDEKNMRERKTCFACEVGYAVSLAFAETAPSIVTQIV